MTALARWLPVALVACSTAAPVEPTPVANRAEPDAPLTAPTPCSEPPESDHITLVARFVIDKRCIVLADWADGPMHNWPAAWTWDDRAWQLVRLDDYVGHEWKGGVVTGGELVGVLDNAVESPAWELAVAVTRDGRAWSERSRVRKVYYFATVAAVELDDRGIAIAVDLDDDYGAGVRPGRMIYRSADAGRTWTGVRAAVP